MSIKRWLSSNTRSLAGKTVALTGSTGGLGLVLSAHLARLGARLILLDRSLHRSEANRARLLKQYPSAEISCLTLDLSDIQNVRCVTETLASLPLDVFIHNAGAYSIPRKICESGYDNVFQINYASPYYMIRTLLPTLRARGGHVMAVGSIAHRYSAIDTEDVDFRTRGRASLVYGNAKRHLMFSLYDLFRTEREVTLAVTHPGITQTNITAHYPKLIYAVIKYPMRIIFMRPRRAVLPLLQGVFAPTEENEWIGPRLFDVWGSPKKKTLHSVSDGEAKEIARLAEEVYARCKGE